MKTLILNSGLGHRMGDITKKHPKCMTELFNKETILSRQLSILKNNELNDVIITTGYYDNVLVEYCKTLKLGMNIKFIKNPIYDKTNYIYSIYSARNELKDNDILLMHGDLVFDEKVLKGMLCSKRSCMKVSTTIPLPEKDFKAVIEDGKIKAVGIEFFDNSVEAQALYKLNRDDWKIWLDKIIEFCERGNTNCYAEVALNEVANKCSIYPYDAKNELCTEIDTPEDLKRVKEMLL